MSMRICFFAVFLKYDGVSSIIASVVGLLGFGRKRNRVVSFVGPPPRRSFVFIYFRDLGVRTKKRLRRSRWQIANIDPSVISLLGFPRRGRGVASFVGPPPCRSFVFISDTFVIWEFRSRNAFVMDTVNVGGKLPALFPQKAGCTPPPVSFIWAMIFRSGETEVHRFFAHKLSRSALISNSRD